MSCPPHWHDESVESGAAGCRSRGTRRTQLRSRSRHGGGGSGTAARRRAWPHAPAGSSGPHPEPHPGPSGVRGSMLREEGTQPWGLGPHWSDGRPSSRRWTHCCSRSRGVEERPWRWSARPGSGRAGCWPSWASGPTRSACLCCPGQRRSSSRICRSGRSSTPSTTTSARSHRPGSRHSTTTRGRSWPTCCRRGPFPRRLRRARTGGTAPTGR